MVSSPRSSLVTLVLVGTVVASDRKSVGGGKTGADQREEFKTQNSDSRGPNKRDTRVSGTGQEEPQRKTGEVDGAVRENGKMEKWRKGRPKVYKYHK
jgi:hypothetical protein